MHPGISHRPVLLCSETNIQLCLMFQNTIVWDREFVECSECRWRRSVNESHREDLSQRDGLSVAREQTFNTVTPADLNSRILDVCGGNAVQY